MNFFNDQQGQGSAEYILLFGGIIVVAIAALVIYRSYFSSNSGLTAAKDTEQVRNFSVNATSNSSSGGGSGGSPPPSWP